MSLIRNQTAKDQLRVDGQLRQDFFQIPYDPKPDDYECASDYYCSSGLRDGQTERDAFRDRELGAHDFAEGDVFRGAVLPLQPVELRFAGD